jgi:hypothetical protein
MFFAVLTPVLALKQRKFGILIISIVLIYFAIMMNRMVTPSGIVIVMMLANLLIEGNYFIRLKLIRNKIWTRTIWFVLLILIGVTLYSNVERARYYLRENQAFLGRYPTAMADYMQENHKSGRIFNTYGMGGYLIYRLAPQNQVYIDGRTQILYPLEHMQRYKVVSKTGDPKVLRKELENYSVDQIIWRYSQSRHDLIQETGGFGLDFLDAHLVLYTRGASNFSLLGKLLSNPECWRPDMLSQLNTERQKMDDILPDYSALFPFANLVVGYSNAKDGKAFFDENIDGDKWFDEMRRFAGYRFLETGEYDLVVNLLGGVELLNRKDFLASAFAKIMVGDIDMATQILEDFSNREWLRLKPEETFIQYKLYQLLSLQRDLSTVEREISEALKVKLLDLGYADLGPEHVIDVGSFCAS